MQRILHYGLAFVAIFALTLSTARQADAELRHRYSFANDISDSVGTAHGAVIDAGTTPHAVFANGILDLTANVGQGSNEIVEDAYVDLPNGTISALGDTASFEIWTTVAQNRTWSEIFSFGTSNAGEDISTGGAGSRYVTLIPQAGANRLEVHITQVGLGGGNPIRPGGPLSTGVEHHLVTVIDRTDTMGGANPDGTAYLYLNGLEVARAALYPGFALSALPDVNNWLGRSQWNDPLFDGTYNELRLYNNAVSPNQVLLNAAIGPDQIAEAPPEGNFFTLEVDTVSGDVRLRNNVDAQLKLNYYEITSAGGALSTGGWNSLDDQEGGDEPSVGWDESGGADANELIELFVAEAGDTIGPNEELSLGNAFNPSVFGSGNDGDLVFQFGLTNGLLLPGGVTYVTSAGVPGDYNGNGIVDAADYTVWRNNLGGTSLINEGASLGIVNQADFDFWKSRFGNVSGSGGFADAIPEPNSVVLFVAAAAILAIARRLEGSPATNRRAGKQMRPSRIGVTARFHCSN